MIDSPADAPRAAPFRAQFARAMLDPLSLKYALFARASGLETLDLGCGEGFITAAVLERGGRVLAVDPEPHMLEWVRARVSLSQHVRLGTEVGALPWINFEKHRFAAIHAGYVLPLLDGEQIRQSLGKMLEWLQPEGKIFLSVFTPGGRRWRAFAPTFDGRKRSRSPWPGYIGDVSPLLAQVGEEGSGPFHLLDEDTLRGALANAGFIVEEVLRYVAPWDAQEVCCGVIGHRVARGPIPC
jgi:SAM-dependent methyltransferase